MQSISYIITPPLYGKRKQVHRLKTRKSTDARSVLKQSIPLYFIPNMLLLCQVKLQVRFFNISGACLVLFKKMLLKLVPATIV
jgi:hypothetical protein